MARGRRPRISTPASRPPRLPRAVLGATAALLLIAPGASAAGPAPPASPAGADERLPVAVPAARRTAREALAGRLGVLGEVRTDPRTGGVAWVARGDGALTGPRAAASPEQVVRDYVLANRGVFGLDAGDLDALRLKARAVDPDGITHLRWVQVLDGVEAYDAGLIAHVAADGALIAVAGGAIADPRLPAASPARPAGTGVADARDAVGTPRGLAPAVRSTQGDTTRFASGEQATLRWIAAPGGARLVWQSLVEDPAGASFEVLTDAADGDLVRRRDLTDHLVQARTFRRDPRSAAVLEDLPSSWFDDSAGGTRLWGALARTYADPLDRNPGQGAEGITAGVVQIPATSTAPAWTAVQLTSFANPAGPCPAAGCTWNRSDPAGSQLANRTQSATNAHVLVGKYLTWLAQAPIGFDAASGAFGRDNPAGLPGGGDYVRDEIADGSLAAGPSFDNANFATPPDGLAPRMQMFLWTSPDLNSADDATVVFHELTHGLSNRLVVNASGSSTLAGNQAEMMGEGLSDFYALSKLADDGLVTDGAAADVVLGDYVTGSASGIRAKPIDCPVAPAGLAGCNRAFGPAVAGGYTYGDLARTDNSSPHNGGEIWAETLWDIRRVLGSTRALAHVTGGLRLAPPEPSMLDLRDAILLHAATARSAPGAPDDDYDALWSIFAARGMGDGASTADTDALSVVEDFSVPGGAGLPPARVADPYPGGDADGVAEPGEVLQLVQPLQARRAGGLAPTSGTLATSAPGDATPLQTAASWPALASGQVADPDAPFTARLRGDLACGAPVPLTVTVAGPSGPLARTTLVNTPRGGPGGAIPDDGSPLTLSWTAAGGGPVTDVDVRLGELRHAFLGDLVVELVHDGVTVALIDRLGGGSWAGRDAVDVTFDDEASAPLPTSAVSPLSGRRRPVQALSAFDGHPLAGAWTLRVIDADPGSAGRVVDWGLQGPGQSSCRAEIPAAATGGPSAVYATAATVGGAVTPNGRDTAWRVAYGTSTAYGLTTPPVPVGAGDAAQARSATLATLAPSTTYHYRVEALREGAVAVAGADQTFTTVALGGPGPGTAPPGDRALVVPATRRAALFTGPTGVTLTRAGRLAFVLELKGGARGRLTVVCAGRTLAVRSFRASARGQVRVSARLSRSARRALRRRPSAAVTVTVTVAGRSLARTVRVKVPSKLLG